MSEGTNLLQVQVQPTNAGSFTWTAAVGATGLMDADLTNNVATNVYTVITNEPGELMVTNLADMFIDYQAGLFKQAVRMQNTGTVNVASARLTVTGLTNRLYNAVGTNDRNPFVVFRAPLAPNDYVDLTLEYISNNRRVFDVSNSQYSTVGVLSNNVPIPAGAIHIGMTNSAFVKLGNGDFLIQFLGVSNRTYTIVYSDNDATFTNPVVVQPPIWATSRTIVWTDNGPPKALSFPPSSRFYKVYLNP